MFNPAKLRLTRPTAYFSFKYKNTTNKDIVGTKFTLELMDATRDFTEYPDALISDKKVKPAQLGFINAPINLGNQSVSGFRVYVKKVAFSDGSNWSDDGTGKCRLPEYVKGE